MAASTSAPGLRVFFCGDSETPCQQELECSCLVSEAFGQGRVYLSSPSPFLSAEGERIAQATTLLARNILEIHNLSKVMEHPQRFLVFTYGEGIKVVELALKKLLAHNVDIDVYSFGETTTLISTNLASVVHHYVFQAYLSSQQVALEQRNTKGLSRNEEYFDRHSVTLLVESPPELPDAHRDCEFLAYAKIIQKIAQCYCNAQG